MRRHYYLAEFAVKGPDRVLGSLRFGFGFSFWGAMSLPLHRGVLLYILYAKNSICGIHFARELNNCILFALRVRILLYVPLEQKRQDVWTDGRFVF